MAHEQIDTFNQGLPQRPALFSKDLWISVHRRAHAFVFSVRKASAKRWTQIKASLGSHRDGLCPSVLDARLTATIGNAHTLVQVRAPHPDALEAAESRNLRTGIMMMTITAHQ